MLRILKERIKSWILFDDYIIIIVEYDGTKFVGLAVSKKWFVNSRSNTKKLTKLLKQKIILVGAERTDSGVHALGQSANFTINKKIDNTRLFLNNKFF